MNTIAIIRFLYDFNADSIKNTAYSGSAAKYIADRLIQKFNGSSFAEHDISFDFDDPSILSWSFFATTIFIPKIAVVASAVISYERGILSPVSVTADIFLFSKKTQRRVSVSDKSILRSTFLFSDTDFEWTQPEWVIDEWEEWADVPYPDSENLA